MRGTETRAQVAEAQSSESCVKFACPRRSHAHDRNFFFTEAVDKKKKGGKKTWALGSLPLCSHSMRRGKGGFESAGRGASMRFVPLKGQRMQQCSNTHLNFFEVVFELQGRMVDTSGIGACQCKIRPWAVRGSLGGAEEVAQAYVHHHVPDPPVPSRACGGSGRRGQGGG